LQHFTGGSLPHYWAYCRMQVWKRHVGGWVKGGGTGPGMLLLCLCYGLHEQHLDD